MARILAVDFGEKRIGLATSDASGSLATPRRTLHRKSDEVVLRELDRFCRDEEIALVIFGVPHSPDGAESAFAARIRSFAAKFAVRSTLPVRFHDETLTSDEAARRRNESMAQGDLDPIAAAVLLEDYLQSVGPEVR
ncbi:MAG: Holliday junction resolvase RuvX [Acidobacteriota bacterium]